MAKEKVRNEEQSKRLELFNVGADKQTITLFVLGIRNGMEVCPNLKDVPDKVIIGVTESGLGFLPVKPGIAPYLPNVAECEGQVVEFEFKEKKQSTQNKAQHYDTFKFYRLPNWNLEDVNPAFKGQKLSDLINEVEKSIALQ